jgi:hypothetical protein
MATGGMEPVIRTAITPAKPTPMAEYGNQQVAVDSVKKKTNPKTVQRAASAYQTNNDTENKTYVPEKERVERFNRQMYNYLDGIYTLIDRDMIKEAKESLSSFTNDIYITDEEPIVVEFYRLLTFVEGRLDAPTFRQDNMKLMGIIRNLKDGFGD